MYFRHTIYIVLFTFLSLSVFAQETDSTSIFQQANYAYQNGDFETAVQQYETLKETGSISENATFNLANAYFKKGEIGKSILNYERVLKQNPKNADAIKNLAFVKTNLEQSLDELPELFFITWWKNIVYYFEANIWAWIAVAFAWFALIALAFYFFSKNILFKKTAFSKLVVFTIVAVFSFFVSKINSGAIGAKTEIILTEKQSQAKDAPSENAQNADVFYEGTKLKVLDHIEDFYKTKNADGQIIWVSKKDFEII